MLSASIVLLFLAHSAHAQISFNLAAQPLAQSLTAVGNLANLNIYFDAPTVDGIQAPALKAQLSADDALARLLAGTRLHVVRVDENTVRIVPKVEEKRAQSAHNPNTAATHAPPTEVHLAYAGPNSEHAVSGSATRLAEESEGGGDSSDVSRRNLAEVIVTAQKREERLQDVPVPVTAINATALVESNQLRLQDYFTRVPGLSVTPDDENGAPILTIRGITTGGYTNPTVGIVVDDVPYGASTSAAVGTVAPDIDPYDLSQVEVLRGPQGTLYGAGSMGGLLKYTTVDPSTDRLSGHLQAGTSSVHNGAELGYNFRGALNIPLSDTLAVRVSAFTRRDPGYVDNPVLHFDGVNEQEVDGAHLVALWRPSESFSARFSALYQNDKRFGSNDVYVGLGDLQQNALPFTGRFDKTFQAYSLTLRGKIGDVELTSLSGFNINKFSNSLDDTDTFGPYTQDQFGVPGTPSNSNLKTTKFTQELRMSAPLGSRVDWLLGGFYTHESSPGETDLLAESSPDGLIVGQWLANRYKSTYEEYAAFTDFTIHFTDRFDIQLGGRESQNKQTNTETDTGIGTLAFEGVPSPNVYPESDSKGNAFTYLVTPRFKLTPDLMAYARIASGYRPGGPNPGAAGVGLPPEFNADRTENYELGFKGTVLDKTLSFDASLYYINWKNIQILLIDPNTGTGYYTNGDRAKSQGVELSFEYKPIRGLTIDSWVSWDEAVLTEPFPATAIAFGATGDRLPDSSRFSGNFSVDEQFLLSKNLLGFVGGSVSYIGNRLGEFTGTADRQPFPGYAQADLRAGARYDTWTVSLFFNNVADRRGLLRGGLGSLYPFAFDYIQPRTIGVTVSKTF
jgi:outer membrane receptor protein involved in Fe transport